MTIIFLWCLLPIIVCGILCWAFLGKPRNQDTAVVMGLVSFIGVFILGMAFLFGAGMQGWDHQIFNGEVTKRERVEDTYEKSYDCQCDKKGANCKTCHQTRYTIDWYVHSTIRRFRIDHEDSAWRTIYLKPDPARFTKVKPGDPVSEERSYMNHVKASPESLFHALKIDNHPELMKLVPKYPKIYDVWRINRMLPMGVMVPDVDAWNVGISELVKTIGPKKQANLVIIAVNTADQNYLEVLKAAWLNGRKNDITVVLGAPEWPKITWVGVMAWTDAEIFKIKLQDELLASVTAAPAKTLEIIRTNTMTYFQRKSMKDYAYLEDDVAPPSWMIGLVLLLAMGAQVTAAILARRSAMRYSRYR